MLIACLALIALLSLIALLVHVSSRLSGAQVEVTRLGRQRDDERLKARNLKADIDFLQSVCDQRDAQLTATEAALADRDVSLTRILAAGREVADRLNRLDAAWPSPRNDESGIG